MLITVAVTATDWPTGLLREFWTRHPIVTSIASGFLLLGLAAFVIEELVREWEARRWRRVAAIAYMSLGHLASKMFRGIEFLLTGKETWISPIPPHATVRLQEILDEGAIIADAPAKDRLATALLNTEWLKVARDVLAALKFEHREALARWIPSTLADARLTKAIEHLANLDVARDSLEGSDIRLIKFDDPDYEDHAPAATDRRAEAERATALWADLELQLVATHEAFMRAAGNDGWTNDHGRRVLGPRRTQRLDTLVADVRKRLR